MTNGASRQEIARLAMFATYAARGLGCCPRRFATAFLAAYIARRADSPSEDLTRGNES